jgi:cyanophycinase
MTPSKKTLLLAAAALIAVRPIVSQQPRTEPPATGTIMLGGGRMEDVTFAEFAKRFIALAGGPEALIVIIPTANESFPPAIRVRGPATTPKEMRGYLESQGARHVVLLHTRDRRVANSPEFAKVLRKARGVWIPGGASRVVENTYRGTLVQRELQGVLDRGGVLAGDSAGSIALGCAFLSWVPHTKTFGKIDDALCLVPNVVVTPHASGMVDTTGGKRVNWADQEVLKYVVAHPPTIGINIDESTMLVLHRDEAEVFGEGGVAIFDAAQNKTRAALRLSAGQRSKIPWRNP